MLTVPEAARILGLSEGRTRALIASGKLRAEKRGRQWMVYERSVEARKASGAPAGRPPSNRPEEQAATPESERAFSLYSECRDAFAHGGILRLIGEAQSDEERGFYVDVMNYFLSRKCDELVAEGAF